VFFLHSFRAKFIPLEGKAYLRRWSGKGVDKKAADREPGVWKSFLEEGWRSSTQKQS
jgi:hypothetical protein